MRLSKPLIAITVLISVLSGCHSSSKIPESVTGNETYPPAPAIPTEISIPEARYDVILDNFKEWTYLKLPVSLKSKQLGGSLSGQAWMIRGKEIYMSLRFIGMIEVAILHVKGDSVTAVDKYHKIYISERISDFMRGIPFNIEDLQNLLTGRPFILGSGTPAAGTKRPVLKNSASGWTMTPESIMDNLEYSFEFNASDRLTSTKLSRNLVELFAARYRAPASTPYGMFDNEVTLQSLTGKPMDLTVRWQFAKADWKQRDIPQFTVPSGYRRVSGRSLTDMFQNF